jgi:hypothetical protein
MDFLITVRGFAGADDFVVSVVDGKAEELEEEEEEEDADFGTGRGPARRITREVVDVNGADPIALRQAVRNC